MPTLAAMMGIWEVVIILVLLLLVALGAAVVVGVVLLAARARERQAGPPTGPPAPPGIEQELRALARLKEEGLITEEEFNLKKKRVLGI